MMSIKSSTVLIVLLGLLYLSGIYCQVTTGDFYPFGPGRGDGQTNAIGATTIGTLPAPIANLNGLAPDIANRFQTSRGNSALFTPTSRIYDIGPLASNSRFGLGSACYGRVSQDNTLLTRAQGDINGSFPDAFPDPPTFLTIATCINARASGSSQGSSYQIVTVTNGVRTYALIQIASVEPAAVTRGDRASIRVAQSFTQLSTGTDIYTFPYSSDLSQATTMSVNSNTGGVYILDLNVPPCPCKERLRIVACEALRRRNGYVPGICNV